jgi:glycosyltransferase involved in cell wall biosynthesis
MRIALCSSFVPFINGGYRNIVEWLELMLRDAGHEVERVYLPEVDTPDLLFQQMAAFRYVDLTAADRIICFRPQSHLIPHPHKIVWFIHHLRVFYDLWDSSYHGFPDDVKHRGFRDALHAVDTAALAEARHVFSNSEVVSARLRTYNNIESEPLFPPVFKPERFHYRSMNDEIVYISRLEGHKRQDLLIEALSYCRSAVRLRLSGVGAGESYPAHLNRRAKELGVAERVTIDQRWISEEEKVDCLADCLACAYLPLDEDSYGYPTIEAAHASKPTLTTQDSGGPLEFVVHEVNGLIIRPEPKALAQAMDQLFVDREATRRMGISANRRVTELNISWPHVLERLLA